MENTVAGNLVIPQKKPTTAEIITARKIPPLTFRPVNTAINSCTINPARCLHIDDHKGAIGVGYDGDLVVLDKDYEVIQTYCKGKEMIDGTK